LSNKEHKDIEKPPTMNASKHYYRNKENVDMAQYPYLLEGGSMYANLLYYAHRDDEAKNELVAAALGNVELLGRNHPLSRASVHDAKKFLRKTARCCDARAF
jgi:hypothetical protein